MDYEKNDLRHCKSGITYTLSRLSEEGHVYAEEKQRVKAAIDLLETDESSIRQAMTEMLQSEDLIQDTGTLYMQPFYYAEVGTANCLNNLLTRDSRF